MEKSNESCCRPEIISPKMQEFNGKRYYLQGRYLSRHEDLHRAVWEHYNGVLPYGYVVHHRDGNPLNNSIENLEAMDRDSHNSISARSTDHTNWVNSMREGAKKWHGSEKGKEWHKKHYKNDCAERMHERHVAICKMCGKSFSATPYQLFCCIIVNLRGVVELVKTTLIENVKFVRKYLKQINLNQGKHAQDNAVENLCRQQKQVLNIEPAGHENVYCLTAKGTHSFIANGIAVANCTRYAFLSRPIIPKRVDTVPAGSFAAERRRLIRARQYSKRHGISLTSAYAKVR